MSYQVPDDPPNISRARLFLFNSFCFLTFIISLVVCFFFFFIDLGRYPFNEWITIIARRNA